MSGQQSGMSKEARVIGEPTLREARMHLIPPAQPQTGVVVRNERCAVSRKSASFVRHVEIDVSGTALAGNWLAGQSFGVIPPGLDAHGRPHKVRLYSIACSAAGEDGQGRIISTTVKRTIDEHRDHHRLFLGVCSNYLCDLQVGEPVHVTGPSGKRFVLPADPALHDFLFIATGTGIAPYRGMIPEVLARDPSSRIVLVMGAAYATDLLYHERFEDLSRRHPNFIYLPAISREQRAGDGSPMYVHRRLAAEWGTIRPMLESPRTLIYVCGIAGMELGIVQQLARGLPEPALAQYLRLHGVSAGDADAWTRRQIPREVEPTRRMCIEVYD